MRTCLGWVLLGVCAVGLAVGCGSSGGDGDGGAPAMDAGSTGDAAVALCAADPECDDGTFCSEWRCMPGVAGADARGCIDRGPPCASGETCDEAGGRCVPVDCTVRDADGDGAESVACGGNDCDDGDPNIYPGAAEVCDDVDDDCNPETLGDTDADGDGHISSACCNGATCGDDCADDDALVHPAVMEVCDGMDNNCSGVTDDGTPERPLCPGGTCGSGRCSFSPFDRVYGGTPNHGAAAVATDAVGNIYVTGYFPPGVDFGLGPESGAYVASLTADGAPRWVAHIELGPDGFDAVLAVQGDRVYVATTARGTTRFGTVDVEADSFGQTVIVALDLSGGVIWAKLLPPGTYVSRLDAEDGRLFAAGGFNGTVDFGSGEHTAAGSTDGFIVVLDTDGGFQREMFLGGEGAAVTLTDASVDGAGRVAVAGYYTGGVDFGAGVEPSGSARAGFVWVGDSSLTRVWHRTIPSDSFGVRVEACSLTPDALFLGGDSVGTPSLGGGALVPRGGSTAFIAAYRRDGTYDWSRALDDVPPATWGFATLKGFASGADGTLFVVGGFSGTVGFGGAGGLMTDGSTDMFVARYGAGGAHLGDRSYGGAGDQEGTAITIGPGGSVIVGGRTSGVIDLGSGTRTATGGFVARLRD